MASRLKAVANAEDVFLARVAELPEEFVECRTMQHSWRISERMRIVDSTVEVGTRAIRGEKVYARRIVQCVRCLMKRRDFFKIGSRGGHSALRKLDASYDDSECPQPYHITGIGRTYGMRDLLLGSMLDAEISAVPVKRGRPRKAVTA